MPEEFFQCYICKEEEEFDGDNMTTFTPHIICCHCNDLLYFAAHPSRVFRGVHLSTKRRYPNFLGGLQRIEEERINV